IRMKHSIGCAKPSIWATKTIRGLKITLFGGRCAVTISIRIFSQILNGYSIPTGIGGKNFWLDFGTSEYARQNKSQYALSKQKRQIPHTIHLRYPLGRHIFRSS